MAGFNLTAQLQLQAPTNTSQVVGNIKKQLSDITANVQVKGDAGSLAKINKQMQGVGKNADAAGKGVGNLNRNLSEAARRFSVITVATGTMLALARAIKNAVGEAIVFERELIKISQVTGKTIGNLSGLTDEITRLSVTLGASSKDLLDVARVLAQAGFAADKTKQALEILAQTSLGATFDNIQDTTEGAIAVLRQFRKEARQVGGDIKFLEQTMDAINSVSKKFAVESGDLITVIRRVGGVFESAGGKVNELIALFTSVRATTRESAETIATGLRTIFTRIQRTDTVDQLAELGIQLRDSQGQFVGAYEAVSRLSAGLSGLDPRDFRFSEIVESLGGFRQVGKVIPLIRQFTTAQQALNVAQSASGSVARDAATAQKSLQVQAQKVTQDFQALMRTLTDSSTFHTIANGALAMASAFIKIAEALKPLLPLITSMIALKIGSALGPGLGALVGIGSKRKAAGGQIHGYAKGGFVPGSGNRDTVPAMLQPGEFVIKKSSAKKMGAGALEAMNNNRYAAGGMQPNEARQLLGLKKNSPDWKAVAGTSGGAFAGRRSELFREAKLRKGSKRTKDAQKYPGGAFQTIPGQIGAFVLHPEKGKDGNISLTSKPMEFDNKGQKAALMNGSSFSTYYPDREDLKENRVVADLVQTGAQLGLKRGVQSVGMKVADHLDIPKKLNVNNRGIKQGANSIAKDMEGAVRTTEGYIFEGLIEGITGATLGGGDKFFDFPNLQGEGVKEKLAAMFASSSAKIANLRKADAKRSRSGASGRKEGSLAQKTINDIIDGKMDGVRDISKGKTFTNLEISDRMGESKDRANRATKKAAGGKIDSVPALLTPGEYVINKSAAQSIGYSNLNQMNQTGAQKFAMGGAVQRFAKGGPTGAGLGLSAAPDMDFGGTVGDLVAVEKALRKVGVGGDKLIMAMRHVESSFDDGVGPAKAFDDAFDDMRKGIDATKKAAEQEVDVIRSKAKGAGAGDVVAEDVKRFGGPAGVDEGALETGKAAKTDTKTREILVARQKEEIAAIQKSIRSTEKGVTASNAYRRAQDVVRDKYGVLAKEIEKSKSSLQKLGGGVGRVGKAAGKKVAGAAGAVGRQAAGMQGAAQAAQSMAFFGGTVAATAVQMSGMGDVMKQATTETIGFATGIAAGGATVIQMLSGLANIGKAAAAANMLEATGSGASTGADLTETGASSAAATADTVEAGASMAAAGPLLILIAVVAAVVIAMKFFASKAKAEADALAKSRKENLDKIGSGKGGSVSAAKESVGEELDLRNVASGFNAAAYSAGGAALATAALGATLGSGVPIVGTALGALAGAAIGYYLATRDLTDAQKAAAEAQKQLVSGIYTSIDTFARLSESSNKFDSAMTALDKVKLPDTLAGKGKRIQQELDITKELDVSGIQQEFGQLAKVAAEAGVSVGALSESDLIEKFGEGSSQLTAFQVASRSTGVALANLTKKSAAASSTLQKAADLEIRGDKTFAELTNGSGLLATAFRASQAAIEAETQGKLDLIRADKAAAEERMKAGTGDFEAANKDLDAAKKKEIETIKQGAAAKKNEADAIEMTAIAARERVLADRQTAAAAEVLRQSLLETSKFLMELSDIEMGQMDRAASLSNQAAIQSGGDMDFSRKAPAGLSGDITMIKDLKQFNDEMMAAINDLPPKQRAEAKKQLKTVSDTSKLFTEGKENVVKQFGTAAKVGTNLKGLFGEDQIEEIIEAAGLDPDDLKKRGLFKELSEIITKEGKDGITSVEFDEMFAPFKEEGDVAKGSLEKINELRNNEISNYASYLDNVKAKREADIQLLQNVLTANDKARDLVAQAKGTTVSGQEKEMSRRRSAQLNLSGTGVAAGDAAGAARALKLAQLQRKEIEKEIQNRKAAGNSVLDLMQKDKKLQDTIAKTTQELGRLADQSDRASDMISKIEEERGKREVMTGIITDFVVGGGDERKGIMNAMAGIQNAVATGTLQGQTPEQRSATVGMLDKLENIILPGMGGLTGKQVKQELVFRDAIKMGLDPAIAKELATATSKEEQLIKAVERLTEEMKFAAKQQAIAGMASGGPVQYRAGGGSIFQPKGTDTVPAMLTPGEFVIRKSAVDKIGKGNLAALNNGYAMGGPVQYRQGGGGINAGNAAFVGGNVNFPSGDAIKAMFADAVRSNPRMFFKRLRSSGMKQSGKIAKDMSLLISNNALNPNNITFADTLAAQMDRFTESSDIFQRASSNGVTMKGLPIAKKYSGKAITLAEANVVYPEVLDYVSKLGRVAQKGVNVVGKDRNRRDILASNIINDRFGVNPASKAQFLQVRAMGKYKSVASIPGILLKNIQSETHRGEDKRGRGGLADGVGAPPGMVGFPKVGDKAVAAQTLVTGEEMGQLAAGRFGEADKKRMTPNARKKNLVEAQAFLREVGVLRMASGGGVPGTDTVPAMLTPGEFVMSRQAVATHGVGYMKNLNKGRVPGFNRGGVVGRGAVQYKRDGGGVGSGGGVLSIDPGPLQSVLTKFNTEFSLTLDKIIGSFKGMTQALDNIAKSFDRMEHFHEFRGEIGMSVNISNKDAIIAAVTNGLTPSLERLITTTVERKFEDENNRLN